MVEPAACESFKDTPIMIEEFEVSLHLSPFALEEGSPTSIAPVAEGRGESAGVSMDADAVHNPAVVMDDIDESMGELEVLREDPVEPEVVASAVSLSLPCDGDAYSQKTAGR